MTPGLVELSKTAYKTTPEAFSTLVHRILYYETADTMGIWKVIKLTLMA